MKVGGYKLSALEIEAVLLEVNLCSLETTSTSVYNISRKY
jgi:hypothetical protein